MVTADLSNDEWTPAQKLVVMLCFVINMVDGMDVLILSFLAPTLQDEWVISAASFATAFSAGLAGMAIGGVLVAPLADTYGRRRMILLALAVMTLGMFASSQVQSITQLLLARLMIGIGIGTVLASMAALASENSPPKFRNFAVGLLQAGYPIGATMTGFVVAWALPLVGWRHVLIGATLVSVLLLSGVYCLLPRDKGKVQAVQISGTLRFARLIDNGRFAATLLLWSATICGFMVLYFIVSWITKLAIESGLEQPDAIVAGAIYNVGAFAGTVGLSLLAMRFRLQRLIFAFMLVAAAIMLLFGGVKMPLILALVTVFLLGVALQGGFNGLYPLAAQIYPSEIRVTGIGWAFGIGRIGAFSGPLAGGWALDAQFPLVVTFGIFCVPLVIAASCAMLVRTEDGR
jgi:MFS transporter, AAHS family, 4-hydroxybenzoate transporter